MNYYDLKMQAAAERLAALMALPMPETDDDIGCEGIFDPWELFPSLYGSYRGSFDRCAIEVLTELLDGEKRRDDLGAEMFREMLCTAELCDYGTSPRVCFPHQPFKDALPELIAKWKAWSLIHWSVDVALSPTQEKDLVHLRPTLAA